jgi:hypothetical protein
VGTVLSDEMNGDFALSEVYAEEDVDQALRGVNRSADLKAT